MHSNPENLVNEQTSQTPDESSTQSSLIEQSETDNFDPRLETKREIRPETRREIGGRPGPDPTRYGDWEKDGRCIDF